MPTSSRLDGLFEEKKFHLHYFAGGASNCYIAEVDPATGKAFSGSWTRPAAATGNGDTCPCRSSAVNLGDYRVVERDCYFSQGNLAISTATADP
jgi:hypothetical protein